MDEVTAHLVGYFVLLTIMNSRYRKNVTLSRRGSRSWCRFGVLSAFIELGVASIELGLLLGEKQPQPWALCFASERGIACLWGCVKGHEAKRPSTEFCPVSEMLLLHWQLQQKHFLVRKEVKVSSVRFVLMVWDLFTRGFPLSSELDLVWGFFLLFFLLLSPLSEDLMDSLELCKAVINTLLLKYFYAYLCLAGGEVNAEPRFEPSSTLNCIWNSVKKVQEPHLIKAEMLLFMCWARRKRACNVFFVSDWCLKQRKY